MQEWGDSRAPVYVRSSTETNICFSFRGRSKNWWRRPLKILVVSGKRLLSLNLETSYIGFGIAWQIAPPGFTNGSSCSSPEELCFMPHLWGRWWPISESRLRLIKTEKIQFALFCGPDAKPKTWRCMEHNYTGKQFNRQIYFHLLWLKSRMNYYFFFN